MTRKTGKADEGDETQASRDVPEGRRYIYIYICIYEKTFSKMSLRQRS